MPDNHGFVPLSQTLPFWPSDGFGDGSFLDNVGVRSFTLREGPDELGVAGELVWLEELVLRIPGLDGFEIAFLAEGDVTVIGFDVDLAPDFSLSIPEMSVTLRFTTDVLRPVERDGDEWKPITRADGTVRPAEVAFAGVGVRVTLPDDVEIVMPTGAPTVSLGAVEFGDSGIVLEIGDLGLYLSSRQTPPPGAPEGFKGVSIGAANLYLPPDMDVPLDLRHLAFEGLVIGTGGFSGVIRGVWGPGATFDDARKVYTGAGAGTFIDTPFAIRQLSVAFSQNIPVETSIGGEFFLGFFEKRLGIDVGVGSDGDFLIALSGAAGEGDETDGLIKLELEDVANFTVNKLTFERKQPVFVVIMDGELQPLLGGLDWPTFELRRLSIGSNGDVDIEGGWIDFPETLTLDFHGFKIDLSEFGIGTEGVDGSRQWIGVSGAISLVEGLPLTGSVEGLKVAWNKTPPRDVSVSLEGVDVTLEIPNLLKFDGSVSYQTLGDDEAVAGNASETGDAAPGGLTGHLFTGAINLDLMPLKTEVDAQLMIGEITDAESGQSFKVFYIAVQAGLPVGIPLGPSLSIYELQGLFGVHVAPHRKLIEGEPEPWYAWYKGDPEYNVTSVSKWWPEFDHYAFGAGLLLGTSYDDGFSLNIGALAAVLVPGPIVMIEGRANFLKQRGDRTQEGALYMLAVFDGIAQSFQLNIDINYSLEGIVEVGGGMEALFFFTKDKAHLWHIYIGQREPESKRIRAEVITIISADTYLMVDHYAIQFGARAGVDETWRYGPVELTLKLIFEFYAGLFLRKPQFEGMISLYGEIAIRVLGIGLQLILQLLLEGKAPDPFHVYGLARIAIKLPFPLPSFDVKVEFSWGREAAPEHVRHLKSAAMTHHKVKGLSWDLSTTEAEAPRVPVDAVPVLVFAKPIRPLSEVLTEDAPNADRAPYEYDEVAGWRFTYQQPDVELWVKGDDGGYSRLVKQSPLRASDLSETTPFDMALLPDTLAKEPKLQLWGYAPLDRANKYEREDYDGACMPRVQPQIICVDWFEEMNQTYPLEFNYERLNFAVDLAGYRHGARVYRGELRTTSILITFPEMTDFLEISFTLLASHQPPSVIPYYAGVNGDPLPVERLSATEARVRADGQLYDAVHIVGGAGLLRPSPGGPGGGVVVDPIGDGPTGGGDGGLAVIREICYRRASQTGLRKEVENTANPYNPTSFRTGLMLEPNKDYRLTVKTFVDRKPIEGRSDRVEETEHFFFSTGDAPGTLYPPNAVDYADKKPNDLSAYVDKSTPANGAPAFYYAYDVTVRFSETYVEALYEGTLSLRLRDQNGAPLGAALNSWFAANWERLLTPGLLAMQSAKDARGCPAEWDPHVPRYLYSTSPAHHHLAAQRLYRAELTSSLVDPTGKRALYTFEFVTSRYATFTEHLTSLADAIESEPAITVQSAPGVSTIATVSLSGYDALVTELERTRRELSDIVALRVGADALQTAAAAEAVENAKTALDTWRTETFAALDLATKPVFDAIGMTPRPLPPKVELVKLRIAAGGHLLLLQSPEPLDFDRIDLELTLDGAATPFVLASNPDKTQAYLVRPDRSGFVAGRYRLSAVYSGGGEQKPDLTPITRDGEPVAETVALLATL